MWALKSSHSNTEYTQYRKYKWLLFTIDHQNIVVFLEDGLYQLDWTSMDFCAVQLPDTI